MTGSPLPYPGANFCSHRAGFDESSGLTGAFCGVGTLGFLGDIGVTFLPGGMFTLPKIFLMANRLKAR